MMPVKHFHTGIVCVCFELWSYGIDSAVDPPCVINSVLLVFLTPIFHIMYKLLRIPMHIICQTGSIVFIDIHVCISF
jgi:hypothetical protein